MKHGWAYEAPDSSDGINVAPWDPKLLASIDSELEAIAQILDADQYRSTDQGLYDPRKFFNRRIFELSDGEREIARRTDAGKRLAKLIDHLEADSNSGATFSGPEVPATHP